MLFVSLYLPLVILLRYTRYCVTCKSSLYTCYLSLFTFYFFRGSHYFLLLTFRYLLLIRYSFTRCSLHFTHHFWLNWCHLKKTSGFYNLMNLDQEISSKNLLLLDLKIVVEYEIYKKNITKRYIWCKHGSIYLLHLITVICYFIR